ncbi:conserved hypothetical protein [Burkholderiales bacterium 8X]|nr:conserved hypothetical protein [Burkholderiales bacterium 8X]
MSALPLQPREARLEAITPERIAAVSAVEQQVYSHPWSPTNFSDSLIAGYQCQCLVGPPASDGAPPVAAEGRTLWSRWAGTGKPAAAAPAPSPAATPAVPAAPVTLLPDGSTLIGYYIAMKGVDEVHLLNITVAPAFQRQGWASMMLELLATWSRGQGAQWLWLEARASNLRALEVYERHGYRRVGLRKAYYPGHGGVRENAVVMSLRLNESPSAWGGLQ